MSLNNVNTERLKESLNHVIRAMKEKKIADKKFAKYDIRRRVSPRLAANKSYVSSVTKIDTSGNLQSGKGSKDSSNKKSDSSNNLQRKNVPATNITSGVFSVANESKLSAVKKAKSYVCGICQKSFPTWEIFVEHLNDSHPTYSSRFINESFLTKSTNIKLYECIFCGQNFPDVHQLSQHLQLRGKSSDSTCPICRCFFVHPETFSRHIKEHSIYTCKSCSLKFTNIADIKNHNCCPKVSSGQQHSGNSCLVFSASNVCDEFEQLAHSCKHCNAAFTLKSDYDNHNCSPKILYKAKNLSSLKELKCKGCAQDFKTPELLSEHIKNYHSLDSAFSCQIWNEFFAKYLRHRNDGNSMFCIFCLQEFPTLWKLKIHYQQTHPNKSLYECKVCTAKFKILGNLCHHIRISHKMDTGYNVAKNNVNGAPEEHGDVVEVTNVNEDDINEHSVINDEAQSKSVSDGEKFELNIEGSKEIVIENSKDSVIENSKETVIENSKEKFIENNEITLDSGITAECSNIKVEMDSCEEIQNNKDETIIENNKDETIIQNNKDETLIENNKDETIIKNNKDETVEGFTNNTIEVGSTNNENESAACIPDEPDVLIDKSIIIIKKIDKVSVNNKTEKLDCDRNETSMSPEKIVVDLSCDEEPKKTNENSALKVNTGCVERKNEKKIENEEKTDVLVLKAFEKAVNCKLLSVVIDHKKQEPAKQVKEADIISPDKSSTESDQKKSEFVARSRLNRDCFDKLGLEERAFIKFTSCKVVTEKSGESSYKCDYCIEEYNVCETYTDWWRLDIHYYRFHPQVNPYVCNQFCWARFKTMHELCTHMEDTHNVHMISLFETKLTVLPKPSERVKAKRERLRKKVDPVQFGFLHLISILFEEMPRHHLTECPLLKCIICNHEFSKLDSVKYHMVNVHYLDKESSEKWGTIFRKFGAYKRNENGTLFCQYCDSKFTRWWYLNLHFIQYHPNEQPYECIYCGKSHLTFDKLRMHLQVFHSIEGSAKNVKLTVKLTKKANEVIESIRKERLHQKMILENDVALNPLFCNGVRKKFSMRRIEIPIKVGEQPKGLNESSKIAVPIFSGKSTTVVKSSKDSMGSRCENLIREGNASLKENTVEVCARGKATTQETVTKTQDAVTKTQDTITKTQETVIKAQDTITKTQEAVSTTQETLATTSANEEQQIKNVEEIDVSTQPENCNEIKVFIKEKVVKIKDGKEITEEVCQLVTYNMCNSCNEVFPTRSDFDKHICKSVMTNGKEKSSTDTCVETTFPPVATADGSTALETKPLVLTNFKESNTNIKTELITKVEPVLTNDEELQADVEAELNFKELSSDIVTKLEPVFTNDEELNADMETKLSLASTNVEELTTGIEIKLEQVLTNYEELSADVETKLPPVVTNNEKELSNPWVVSKLPSKRGRKRISDDPIGRTFSIWRGQFRCKICSVCFSTRVEFDKHDCNEGTNERKCYNTKKTAAQKKDKRTTNSINPRSNCSFRMEIADPLKFVYDYCRRSATNKPQNKLPHANVETNQYNYSELNGKYQCTICCGVFTLEWDVINHECNTIDDI